MMSRFVQRIINGPQMRWNKDTWPTNLRHSGTSRGRKPKQTGRPKFSWKAATTMDVAVKYHAVSVDDECTTAVRRFCWLRQWTADTLGGHYMRHPRSQFQPVQHQLSSHQQPAQVISGGGQLSPHAVHAHCIHDVRLDCIRWRQKATAVADGDCRLFINNAIITPVIIYIVNICWFKTSTVRQRM